MTQSVPKPYGLARLVYPYGRIPPMGLACVGSLPAQANGAVDRRQENKWLPKADDPGRSSTEHVSLEKSRPIPLEDRPADETGYLLVYVGSRER